MEPASSKRAARVGARATPAPGEKTPVFRGLQRPRARGSHPASVSIGETERDRRSSRATNRDPERKARPAAWRDVDLGRIGRSTQVSDGRTRPGTRFSQPAGRGFRSRKPIDALAGWRIRTGSGGDARAGWRLGLIPDARAGGEPLSGVGAVAAEPAHGEVSRHSGYVERRSPRESGPRCHPPCHGQQSQERTPAKVVVASTRQVARRGARRERRACSCAEGARFVFWVVVFGSRQAFREGSRPAPVETRTGHLRAISWAGTGVAIRRERRGRGPVRSACRESLRCLLSGRVPRHEPPSREARTKKPISSLAAWTRQENGPTTRFNPPLGFHPFRPKARRDLARMHLVQWFRFPAPCRVIFGEARCGERARVALMYDGAWVHPARGVWRAGCETRPRHSRCMKTVFS